LPCSKQRIVRFVRRLMHYKTASDKALSQSNDRKATVR
jgi:hypothetical protein